MGFRVLLVEDSPEDVEAVRRTLARSHPAAVLECLGDGDRALARLLDPADTVPDLVLLDLNIPGLNGRAVLSTLRGNAGFSDVPVVVLTSSTNTGDIDACYRAGATSYLFKPVDLALFQVVLRGAFEQWLGRWDEGQSGQGSVKRNDAP